MKTLFLSLALVPLVLCPHNLRADDFSLTLNTGVAADTLVETPILNGEQFTYLNTTDGLFTDGNLLNSSTSLFTATYVDALGTLGVLNITDVCAHVTIFGPAVPCQAFAASFTNLTLGDASIVAALGAVASVDADVANLNIASGSIAGGSGSFDFGAGTPPAVTPEPSTLCLMGTGLVAAAGIARRRLGAIRA